MSRASRSLPLVAAGLLSACSAIGPDHQAVRSDVSEPAVQRALESSKSGQTTAWQDPATGAATAVTPQRTFRVGNGRYCRDYALTYLTPEGQRFAWDETACRFEDQGWRRVDRIS